jgi:hypothetical protein
VVFILDSGLPLGLLEKNLWFWAARRRNTYYAIGRQSWSDGAAIENSKLLELCQCGKRQAGQESSADGNVYLEEKTRNLEPKYDFIVG